jgi:hypothetical protein
MPLTATAGQQQQQPAVLGAFGGALGTAGAGSAGAAFASASATARGTATALPQQHHPTGTLVGQSAANELLRQQMLARVAAAVAGQHAPAMNMGSVSSSSAVMAGSASRATTASARPAGHVGQQPWQPAVPPLVQPALQQQQQAFVGGLAGVLPSGTGAANAVGLQRQQPPAVQLTPQQLQALMQQQVGQQVLGGAASAAAVPLRPHVMAAPRQ